MIHYLIFTNKGTLIDKTAPNETMFIHVSVFGNAEKIACFDKNNYRIWSVEPNHIETDRYKGSYDVFSDEFERWGELLKTCKNAEERMIAFKKEYEGYGEID